MKLQDRIIVDHIGKTAGQSLNRFISIHTDTQWVTPNLEGEHDSLIVDYGGSFSVISAHVTFQGRGLDPRYKYVTILRNPVSRVISWLNFVNYTIDASSANFELKQSCSSFLRSEGEQVDDIIINHVSNHYVKHFKSIIVLSSREDRDVEIAIDVCSSYDLILDTDKLSEDADVIAEFFGFKRLYPFPKLNTTKISSQNLSERLIERIVNLNKKDIEIFDRLSLSRRVPQVGEKVINKTLRHPCRIDIQSHPYPIPVYWKSNALWQFQAADLIINNGFIAKGNVTSRGEFGFVLSGPFVELAHGDYIVGASVLFSNSESCATLFLTCKQGSHVLAQTLIAPAFAESRATGLRCLHFVAFSIREDVFDFETKFFTPQGQAIEFIFTKIISVKELSERLRVCYEQISENYLCLSPFCSANTVAGGFSGHSIETNCEEGLLYCRGYVQFRAGHYCIYLMGQLGPAGLGGAELVIVKNMGKDVIKNIPLVLPAYRAEHIFDDCQIAAAINIHFENDIDDAEICVCSTEFTEFSLWDIILIGPQ